MNELVLILLALVLLIAVIIAIIKYVYFPRKHGEKGSRKETMDYIARKFDDLMGLRAIIIISKESGILLYSYIIESGDQVILKNPEFISGVLHALRSLGTEMGFSGHEFNRIQYGDYSILSNTSHHAQAVIISRTAPSSILEDNLLILGKAIDKKFFGTFIERKNYYETNEFSDTISLIREIFDTFFIEGLNLLYNPEQCDQLERLSRIILDEARKQYNHDDAVVLKKLFINMYGNNVNGIQEKYKREEIIHQMYKLFKDNYFSYFTE